MDAFSNLPMFPVPVALALLLYSSFRIEAEGAVEFPENSTHPKRYSAFEPCDYSTVTDFARLRLVNVRPLASASAHAKICRGHGLPAGGCSSEGHAGTVTRRFCGAWTASSPSLSYDDGEVRREAYLPGCWNDLTVRESRPLAEGTTIPRADPCRSRRSGQLGSPAASLPAWMWKI